MRALASKRNRDRVRRVTTDNANPLGLLDLEPAPRSLVNLSEIEDRRSFAPGVYKPARTFRGRARLKIHDPKPSRLGRRVRGFVFSPLVRFAEPAATLICVRRHRRREVLFAKARAGRGAMRRPVRTAWSKIICGRR